MALLYRFTQLEDRGATGVFTFIATRSVTRDLHRDATTRDFSFAHQRWAVTLSRTDRALGAFLLLRSSSSGCRVLADFTFTLLNREHFSRNETHAQRQRRFSADCQAHGVQRWLPLQDLHTRRFTDDNGEFLMELSMANVTTLFECDVRTGQFPFASGGTLETPHFSFGGYEWNVAVSEERTGGIRAALNRLTGFEMPCRARYRLRLGCGEQTVVDSGLLDQISDQATGVSRGTTFSVSLADLGGRRGLIHVATELQAAHPLSEARVKPAETVSANCYDREKQSWCVQAEVEEEGRLRVKLFCTDLHHVPCNHVRYVAWRAAVLRRGQESVALGSHSSYYVQDGVDMGIVMETTIPSLDVQHTDSPYLDSEGLLTVHIEWVDSQLLFSSGYHKHDDLYRLHCQQMKREVAALQAENYGLERQLFSYQKSLSQAHAGKDDEDDCPNHNSSPPPD